MLWEGNFLFSTSLQEYIIWHLPNCFISFIIILIIHSNFLLPTYIIHFTNKIMPSCLCPCNYNFKSNLTFLSCGRDIIVSRKLLLAILIFCPVWWSILSKSLIPKGPEEEMKKRNKSLQFAQLSLTDFFPNSLLFSQLIFFLRTLRGTTASISAASWLLWCIKKVKCEIFQTEGSFFHAVSILMNLRPQTAIIIHFPFSSSNTKGMI